ncbi:MAG: hypothetical protein J6R67_01970 [Treponema sp.]|nr:hypothetical protein [Treponema sp.]
MKSKKMVASTIAMLVMTCSILSFVSCDNMNSNNNGNTQGTGGRNFGTKSGNTSLPFLTKEEIKAKFDETNPANLESLIRRGSPATIKATAWGEQNMSKLPSFESPYFAGEPRSDIMDLALARYNFVRRFAGLNAAVFNEQFHREAQHAAWLCAMYQKTDRSHSITAYQKPEGVTGEMWNLAAAGLQQCLHLAPHAANSVDIYMADNKNGNLGHRVNLLTLTASQVGFGVASANLVNKNRNDPNVITGTYGATAFRFNWQKQPDYEDFEYDMVSWPPAGYFPAKTSLFDSGVDKARWSIYFNNNKYALQTTADSNGVKTNVIVTKTVNGETKQVWDFAKIASNVEAFKNKNYTLTEGESWCSITYGGTTIFYLASIKNGQESLEQYTDGSVYTVRFENLVDKVNGGFTNLEYAVEFFDMSTVQ